MVSKEAAQLRDRGESLATLLSMDALRVVIIGGGFGGLACARALRKAPVQITLLDRHNHYLFQPLLYQVATGGLAPSSIATPLRTLLARQSNCRVLLGQAKGIEPDTCRLITDGDSIPFDILVIACGSRHHYFGHDGWAQHAPGLKTVADALEMRRRIFGAFERAERAQDVQERARLLTFVVVGGGPTGVELAGALAEIALHTLRKEFRAIDPATARIVLVETEDQLLAGFSGKLRQRAAQDLVALRVEVRCHAKVTDVDDAGICYVGREGPVRVEARTVLWAAGVTGVPFASIVAERLRVPLGRQGRLVVGSDCALPGHENIFAIGDIAAFNLPGGEGRLLPGVALVAIQQGEYVGRLIRARLSQRELPPFTYHDLGTMATIGKRRAVAQIGKWSFSGLFAYVAWALLHIARLVTVQNRLLVIVQWLWYYVSWDRGARLITISDLEAAHPEPNLTH